MEQTGVFSEYARYYDLLYKDKDYEAEADYIERLIKGFRPETKSVLELGSGTGIHALHLAKRGYEVTGIEISADMIKVAKQKVNNSSMLEHPNPLFLHGDIRTARLSKTYDAVIALFHVMSYQTTNMDVLAAFTTAREHLRPGGVFLFDIWYGPAVLTERPSVRIKRMADERTVITRIAEPVMKLNESIVEVHYHVFVENREPAEVRELKEIHVMRYFFYTEIDLIARKNNLCIQNAEEWFTGEPIGAGTWSAVFLLQAKPE